LNEDCESREAAVLKGHGFSRADIEAQGVSALAAEGCFWTIYNLPSGAKARGFSGALWHD
jgi:hypothetical protein